MVSVGAARWADALDGALRVCGANGVELLGQRQSLFTGASTRQLVAVDQVVDLWNQRVQQAGHRGDEDEGADEDAGIEVQAAQQCRDAVGSGGNRVE